MSEQSGWKGIILSSYSVPAVEETFESKQSLTSSHEGIEGHLPTGYVIESKYPRSMAFRAAGIGVGLIMLLIGGGLIALALDLLGFGPILPGGGLVSGGLLLIIGLILMYKGASRKEAKEEV